MAAASRAACAGVEVEHWSSASAEAVGSAVVGADFVAVFAAIDLLAVAFVVRVAVPGVLVVAFRVAVLVELGGVESVGDVGGRRIALAGAQGGGEGDGRECGGGGAGDLHGSLLGRAC